jgi:hypothetical protein
MVNEFTNFVLLARWRDCENTSQAVEGGRRPQLEGQQLLAGQHSGLAFSDVPISVQIPRVCQTCAFPVLSNVPCISPQSNASVRFYVTLKHCLRSSSFMRAFHVLWSSTCVLRHCSSSLVMSRYVTSDVDGGSCPGSYLCPIAQNSLIHEV